MNRLSLLKGNSILNGAFVTPGGTASAQCQVPEKQHETICLIQHMCGFIHFKDEDIHNDFVGALLELTGYIYGNIIEDSSVCYNMDDINNHENISKNGKAREA